MLYVFKCNRKMRAKYSCASKCKAVKNQIGVQFKRLYVCYKICNLLLFCLELWRNGSTQFLYRIYFYVSNFFYTYSCTFSHTYTHMQIYKVLSSLSFLISAPLLLVQFLPIFSFFCAICRHYET